MVIERIGTVPWLSEGVVFEYMIWYGVTCRGEMGNWRLESKVRSGEKRELHLVG